MFCGIKKMVQCLINSSGITNLVEAAMTDLLELRRFGINENGVIEYDDFHEPVNLKAQTNYLSSTFYGKVEKQTLENDSESRVGGRSDDKEYIQVQVPYDLDILEGDILIYPVDSGFSYRVIKDFYEVSLKRRTITATNEDKITE